MTLPEGWAETRLGDVCELLNGRAYKRQELLNEGKYPVLRVGNFFTSDKWYYSDLELEPEKYCDKGDLLYAWSASFGPRLWTGGKVIYHYHIWRTRLAEEALDKQFLFHWFEWDKENIKAAHGTGTTMIHVTKGDMENRVICLPPLTEQRRIVAKLDALIARLARARAELDRVPVLAERLRDESLVSAFNGTLIEEDGEPRSAWRTVRFDEAAEIASNLVDPAGFGELPHIAPNHIASGRPKLLPYKTVAKDGVISGKHRFYPGQIVYSKIRPYLRKVVHVDFEGACSADMYPINARCHARYLMYWMLSPEFTWLASQQEGRTVLPKINQKALSSIPTPVAPEPVQAAIAARLDVVFARADRMEAEAARARALIDRLEAAILCRAFRGELVPQDPEDEPASVLLDRIRAQRASAPMPKRGRRKKVSA